MEPMKCFYAILAKKVISELGKRNIEGYYCDTKEEAAIKALELVPQGSTVSFGGSATLHEIGLRSALKSAKYIVWDPDDATGPVAKDDIARRAMAADYYFMGANAITESGELVNIDGYGNRTSALIFGPKHVIVIAGMNKIRPDIESAILRAKKTAAPLIMLKFKRDYASFEELSTAAERACCQLVITAGSMTKGRITVLLAGENLGF